MSLCHLTVLACKTKTKKTQRAAALKKAAFLLLILQKYKLFLKNRLFLFEVLNPLNPYEPNKLIYFHKTNPAVYPVLQSVLRVQMKRKCAARHGFRCR